MASTSGYKRCSPAALDLSQDPGGSVVNYCHMPEPQLCNPRKRQRSEQRPLQLNGASQPLSKRQKLSYPITRSSPSAAFWDNLSKIELTKRALRELDRRNALSALSPRRPSNRRPHRPLTRYALAELKKNRQPSQSAPEYLCSCAPRRLKDIKLFTRHGGPNLTDLRRVCIARYLLVLELTVLYLVPGTCQSSQSHNELEPVPFSGSKTRFDIHPKYQSHDENHNHQEHRAI